MLERNYINGLGIDSTKDEKLFVMLVEEQVRYILLKGNNICG
jgi:hypothetical protein